MTDGALRFRYRFRFASGREAEVEVELDRDALESRRQPKQAPEWTRLDFHRCSHCPLAASEPDCPLAVRLVPLVEACRGVASHDPVAVEAVLPERSAHLSTTAQRAFSSLMGLLVATSGCPYTDFLKPMARFHLPMASEEETVYRAVSMYLLGQYFKQREGLAADWELTGLIAAYRDLRVVNKAMAERLRPASERDSAVNALVLLDLLAKMVPYSVEDSLADIRYLFDPYFPVPSAGR
ncbi:MAG: hypothetical protein AB7U30_06800 [Sulfuricellaceae bacterium]